MARKSAWLGSAPDVQGDTHEDSGSVVGSARAEQVIVRFLVIGPCTQVEAMALHTGHSSDHPPPALDGGGITGRSFVLDDVNMGSLVGVVPDDPSPIVERRMRWWGLVGRAAINAVMTTPSKNLNFARDRLVECYFWILGVFFELYYSREPVITTKMIALISILDNIYDVYGTLEESQQLIKAIQSFARDRLVECYFWILAIYFEPYYSRARVITTKVIAHISILDDIYDVYSTLEESQRLTEAIQRWDAKVVHQLPEYMKDYYLKLIHTFEEFEDLLASGEKYRITYLKEAMKDLSEAYFEESKWRDQHYVPTLEEHLHVSLISSGYPMLKCASFVGMGEIATKEAFEWITSFPKIVQASAIIARIMNDITSHELEQTREHVASTVQCYMKEYGTNVHVACKKLQVQVDVAWKDINEECLNQTAFPVALLERITNYARMAENIYKHIDGNTNSSTKTKEYISLLLVHPIPL
uniref:Terpene synthase metal-binding domain-containing protein n=1 Tax=Musa acuminata subsp. malaccensis TaxID=214687 RepID=A0A804JXX8_MUSAM